MNTKNKKTTSNINVITLGCSKNIYDSEVLMGQLKANNIDVVHESNVAQDNQIVVINTCGFIDNAKQESIDTILQYSALKSEGKVQKVYVTGCLSERYPNELSQEITNIDGFFGTSDMPVLLNKLGADYQRHLLGERLLTTPKHYAYLKIAEGCDRPCSFCAIPLMRGKHISRTIDDIVSEAKYLAKRGTKEFILIAQDLTYYGIDIYKKKSLAKLLTSLSDIDGIEWIRLQYAYPSGFPMDILSVMNERSNICKYLDMPLQHISNNMLQSMRRGITTEKTIELISQIREKVPNIALRTTLIAGYPNETEQEFEEMLAWVEATKFDRLGCFTYSHEENTHAYSLVDNVPQEVKEARVEAIMNLQQEISLSLNQQKIGKEFKVLIDRKEGDSFIGRTEFDSPEVDNEVIISNLAQVKIGEFYTVKITQADDYDLFGTLSS